MRKANVLCKSLSTIESLGSVDVICSDKTGTLTQNRMTAVNVAIGSRRYAALDVAKKTSGDGMECRNLKMLATVAGMCNEADFEGEHGGVDKKLEDVGIMGDATGALTCLTFLYRTIGSFAIIFRRWALPLLC
jgi:sodium/potassium-transporting ATPase subunit alpha